MDTLFDFRADHALSDSQVILGLEAEPEIRRDAEVLAQPQCGVAETLADIFCSLETFAGLLARISPAPAVLSQLGSPIDSIGAPLDRLFGTG